MAKLQRWRRRDPAVDAPAEAPRDGADEGDTVVDTVVDDAPVGPSARTGAGDPLEPVAEPVDEGRAAQVRRALAASGPVSVLQAAHPRQAAATAAFLGIAALAADRPPREAAVVAATALVGQAILGWHNDIVDRARDARHATRGKPVADGRLEVGSAWYAVVVGVLLVVPLSITTGVTAGTFYLAALAVGLLGNVVLRRGPFSFVSWAVQFALYVPYLSLGGWGGGAEGAPPEPAMVVLFALLGVGVHVLRAIWGLVADDADRWTYLPLVLGRRLGATRLLAVAAAYTFVVVAGIVVVGQTVGLRA